MYLLFPLHSMPADVIVLLSFIFFFFFFNDTATTEIYTLSLHDALPISDQLRHRGPRRAGENVGESRGRPDAGRDHQRGPAFRRQRRACDGHRIPPAHPGAVASARGTPSMRLRTIRSFGPTLWGLVTFLIVLAATAPWIPVFLLTVLIQLLIFSTLSYSLNLITGLTGYVSFGHVVFMAFGSYALAFGVGTLNLPPVAGVALGAVVGLALAL